MSATTARLLSAAYRNRHHRSQFGGGDAAELCQTVRDVMVANPDT